MTPIQRLSLASLLLVAAVSGAACNTNKKAQTLSAKVPDDFRIVTRAPLEIPPEYGLRPPLQGEPRPQELDPEAAARTALVGSSPPDPKASPGEQALVKASGGADANPQIKYVIDDEQGGITHKQKGFANLVMFWKPGDAQTVSNNADNVSTPLDPAAEAARIASLTGGKAVVIVSKAPVDSTQPRKFKLPGL